MSFFRQLITEKSGISSMRFMSLAALATGIILAGYGIVYRKDLGGVAELAGMFVASAFTGKFAQKFVERKHPKKEDSSEKVD